VSYLMTNKVINGDVITSIEYYLCDRCKKKICESDWYFSQKKKPFHLCNECAFKEGFFSEKDFLKSSGIDLESIHAIVYNGGVFIWLGRSPFLKHIRPQSTTKKWREEIFARDNYICQKCSQKGGFLNAHHIKLYSKYPELRFEISNGLTLCVVCHKKEHLRCRKNAQN